MKPLAESGEAIICLTCFLLGMVWHMQCFITTAFQPCFRIHLLEGSGKPGWLEIKWYRSIFWLMLIMLI